MASFVQIIISARNSTAAGFNAVRGSFNRMLANMRVAWNRNLNNFASRGGFGPMLSRIGGFFQAAGQQAGQFFVNNFKTIAMSTIGAVAAPIAATLASALIAALGSAVLLAVGGGIIAAGIKAAANSAPVKAAFDQFKSRAKNAFKDFGGPFQGPLVRAADTFAAALERMAPTINRMGQMLAPVIDKLAPALAEMAENALPGIEKAAAAAVPLFEKLAEKLPSIGTAISQFFELVADAEPQITRVFAFIIDALNVIIVVLGGTINFAAKFYTTMIGFWQGVGEKAVSVFNWIKGVVQGVLNWIRDTFNNVRNAAQGAFDVIRNGVGAFGWVGSALSKLASLADAAWDAANAIRSAAGAASSGSLRAIGPNATLRARATGGIVGAASGGARSRLTMVGEHGAELVDFSQGRVYNHNQSKRMMRDAAAGGAGTVVVQAVVGTGAGRAIAEILNRLMRTGDIQWQVNGAPVKVAT